MPDTRFVSYAPNLEDVMLWRALGSVPEGAGRYVEASGHDTDMPNVTRALRQRGWTCVAGLSDRVSLGGPGARETQLLHIDAEAAASGVPSLADILALRPWIVLVSSSEPQPGLEASGYRHVWFDGHNRFYLASDHDDLVRHFILPPNASDNFKTYDPVLEAELSAARRQLVATEQLARSRLSDTAALEAELERRDNPDALATTPSRPSAMAPATTEVAAGRPEIVLRGRARRLGAAVYRLVRPVARPIIWRTRLFMTGELVREMADLRAKLDLLLNRGTVSATGLDSGIAPAIERLLLTLALEQTDPTGRPRDQAD